MNFSLRRAIYRAIQSHSVVINRGTSRGAAALWCHHNGPVFFPPSAPGRRSSRGRRSPMMTSATSRRASCITWVSVCPVTESHRLRCVWFESWWFLIAAMFLFLLVQERCIRCWERWTTECQRRQVCALLLAGDGQVMSSSFSHHPVTFLILFLQYF